MSGHVHTRRRVLGLLSLGAAATSLAACAGTPPATPTSAPPSQPTAALTTRPTEAPKAPTTASTAQAATTSTASGNVTWWALAEFDVDAHQKEIRDTYKQHSPNVSLQIQLFPINNFTQKLAPTLASGSGPDVFVCFSGAIPKTNWTQVTLDLKNLISGPDGVDLNLFDKAAYEREGVVDGHYVGLPRSIHGGQGYFYNKDLFDHNGLPYPQLGWTWKDLEGAAPKFTDKAKRLYGTSINGLNPSDFGFTPISPDHKTVTGYFDGSVSLDAFHTTKRIYDSYSPTLDQLNTEFQDAMSGSAGPLGAFLSKRVATTFIGVASWPLLVKAKLNWGYVNTPWPNDKSYWHKAPKQFVFWSINQNTKNQNGSWDFLKWLTSTVEGATIMAKAGYFVPIKQAVINAKYPPPLLNVMYYQYPAPDWSQTPVDVIFGMECFPNAEWSAMTQKVLTSSASQLETNLHDGAKNGQAALDACWAKTKAS